MRKFRRRKQKAMRKRENMGRFEAALDRVDQFMQRDDPEGALAILEPLADEFGSLPMYRATVGILLVSNEEYLAAIDLLESAYRQMRDVEMLMPLMAAYFGLGLLAHALQVSERLVREGVVMPDEAMAEFQFVRDLIAEQAVDAGVTEPVMMKGAIAMERATLASLNSDEKAALSAARDAVRHLGEWLPARNLLAQTFLINGRWSEAEAEWRRVLERNPTAAEVMVELIRLYAWTGRRAEAEAFWPRVTALETTEDVKPYLVEAAALLEKDEELYGWLRELDIDEYSDGDQALYRRWLATAEANLGKVRQAKKRLKRRNLEKHFLDYRLWTALQAGQKGLGLVDRFHYFHSIEVLRPEILLEILALSEDETVSEDRYTREIRRIAKRYPSLLHFAELMVWYEDQTSFGLDLLDRMATPAAYARLRDFALGQLGEEEDRLDALLALRDAGEIEPGETVRFWRNGAWADLQANTIEIVEPDPMEYDPEAMELFWQGTEALNAERYAEAAPLLEQAIDRDPEMTPAYNNLAIAYLELEEVERAQGVLERITQIAPEYAFAWLNLAGIHLYDHDFDAARTCLSAVAAIGRLSPEEAAHMSVLEAQLAMRDERYDDAETFLDQAADLNPDFSMIQSVRADLERRQGISDLQTLLGEFAEDVTARNRKKRLRFQSKLTTSEPTIDDLIRLYTAEILRKMGAAIAPDYRWSDLRKQETQELLHTVLTDPAIVRRLTQETLAPDEQAALQTVLDKEGAMNWDAFATRFGHDLDESPHWQYHEPQSIMGRLRFYALLVETTVDGQLLVVVPQELRRLLTGS